MFAIGKLLAALHDEAPNVVVIGCVQTGLIASTQTNTDGIYLLGGLRPGAYQMSVEKVGFCHIVLDNLVLNVQDELGRNFTMQLGLVTQSITIMAGEEDNLSSAVSTIVEPRR